MSRSSAEPVDVLLTPAGCRVGQGPRGAHHALPEGPVSWPEAMLGDLPPRARVRATLSDALLRYLVCRWPKTLRGRAEREAWLVHQFRQLHEIDPTQWRVMADADAVDAPFLACAMPHRVETDLRALLDRKGARLSSLSGQFIRQYNAHCPRMSEAQGALAVFEGERMTLGAWLDGRWTRVASQPVPGGDDGAAARALAQLKITGEAAATGTLYVCGGAAAAPAGWTVSTLEVA